MKIKGYDAIVIGSGHAGCESALALARKGISTLLLTLNLDSIAFLACNPSIGGTAKGQLVSEIDALGGQMGINADKATIQRRMLNSSKGAAVQSLRVQADKIMYHTYMKETLENTPNLTIKQAEASDIVVKNGAVKSIKTAQGEEYECKVAVLCTGVYLKSRIIIGEFTKNEGPNGFSNATYLTKSLLKNGFKLMRFKTGTPVRIHGDSINYNILEVQKGEDNIQTFSYTTKRAPKNVADCYLTYTTPTTHKIILDNLDKAPMYSGIIKGEGPRYCPSIETKVVRFSDKERHDLVMHFFAWHDQTLRPAALTESTD
ncbi:MAG: tRNA uridine-5-carboxymethylaminomethyl(34) synthesis enzyme MnmG, partial [Clostridia bacterium]|nr:tRNA uridine-5-carboxymethylaminomethyl(34) synthesis enzyme MnmG [Clostridia bacterium]